MRFTPPRTLLVLTVFLAGSAQATQVAVRAILDPQTIGPGETTTLTLEAVGGGLTDVGFTAAFSTDNFDVVAGPMPGRAVTIVNGSLSQSYRISWQLRATAPGTARVRGIEIRLLGQLVHLADQSIRVQPSPTGNGSVGGAAGMGGMPMPSLPAFPDPEEVIAGMLRRRQMQAAQTTAPAAFVRSEIQPTRPLAGEQVVYTLYLYTRQDIASISPDALPSFHGFWVRDLPLPEQLPTELADVDGVRYTKLPLVRKALFALRPGSHTLEPATVDVGLQTYITDFFAPPFAQTQEVRLKTPELQVDVQPLPPSPPGFGAAVGRFQLSATARPSSLRVGEAATVTVRLSGAGNLSGIDAPTLQAPPGLTVLPPEQKSNERVVGTTVQGERVWTYALVPHSAGSFSVRIAPVPYFDPAQREYRLAQATPITVHAQPAPPPPPSRPAVHTSPAPRPQPSTMTKAAVVGSSLAVGLLVVTVLVRRKNGNGHLTAASNGGEGGGTLNQNLALALNEPHPRRAAALVEEGWRSFVGGGGLPPATTGARRWREAARGQGWGGQAAGELGQIADDISYLRQAPQLSATDELRHQLIARSKGLLRALGH